MALAVHLALLFFKLLQVILVGYLKVIVEFVNLWRACGNFNVDDILVGDVLEILNERTQRIAMGRDKHAFHHLKRNLLRVDGAFQVRRTHRSQARPLSSVRQRVLPLPFLFHLHQTADHSKP